MVNPSDLCCDNTLQDELKSRAVLGEDVLYKDLNHFASSGATFFAVRWRGTHFWWNSTAVSTEALENKRLTSIRDNFRCTVVVSRRFSRHVAQLLSLL